jgi:chitinase
LSACRDFKGNLISNSLTAVNTLNGIKTSLNGILTFSLNWYAANSITSEGQRLRAQN